MDSGFINVRGKLLSFSRPKVMGIVNITPDSFYSASRTMERDDIMRRADRMVEDGVDIFDLGGYSSRPGAQEVAPEEEWRRLDTALAPLRSRYPDVPVSVDTFRSEVARRCVSEYGVEIINDISGGDLDPDMWQTVADLKVAYVLMHMRGTPSTMQRLTDYKDVTAEVLTDLAAKVDRLRSMGVADIIVDPGFGFAKDVDQNFRLLAELDVFRRLGCPLLAGMSHKTMIWKTLDITPEESLNGTVVLDTVALMKGADILRVHEVKEAVETVRLFERLRLNSR